MRIVLRNAQSDIELAEGRGTNGDDDQKSAAVRWHLSSSSLSFGSTDVFLAQTQSI